MAPDGQSSELITQKRICIIGAGAGGLTALKAFGDRPEFQNGQWDMVAFEAREDIGGVWLPGPAMSTELPATSMYDSLTTNIAHPSMAFTAFAFPPSTPLFPTGLTVLKYLGAYASHFGLHSYIKLRTRVSHASWDTERKLWKVRTEPNQINQNGTRTEQDAEDLLFDFLVVANGHFNKPHYPAVSGIQHWLDAGKATHAMWYRRAEYLGDTVLVAGAGPSGQDISTEMRTASKILIQSVPAAKPEDVPGSEGTATLKIRGRISGFGSIEEGEVFFEDGSVERGVDHAILATGYDIDFPFFPESVITPGMPDPPFVPPFPADLYNSAEHVFPLTRHVFPLTQRYPAHAVAFLGLVKKGAPMPMIEVQARAAAAVFADPTLLCAHLPREQQTVLDRQAALLSEFGEDLRMVAKQWMRFVKQEQFEYRRDLDVFSGYPSEVGDWEGELYPHSLFLRAAWRKLEKSGEAQGWVKGVGEAGGEKGRMEWVEMMRRLLKKAQSDEALEKAGKSLSVEGPKVAQDPKDVLGLTSSK